MKTFGQYYGGTKRLKRIIILGGHGDGIVIVSALEDLRASGKEVMPCGFLNDHEPQGTLIGELPVLGKIEDAPEFLAQEDIFFIAALLKVKKSFHRATKIKELMIPLERFFTLVHPAATVSKRAKIGPGTFIGPHVNVMPNAVIGNHCSFRASANIGHDCMIGDFCYMGPNSNLSGRSSLGDGVHIGPNASILDGVKLGDYCVIGMGSVVLKDVPDFAIAFGNPAKVKNKIEVRV
jgi:acetyltransferase EpsM